MSGVWTDDRAADCSGLESQRARKGTGGSNPSPSASGLKHTATI